MNTLSLHKPLLPIALMCAFPTLADNITIHAPNLFPEGIEFNKKTNQFYLGSMEGLAPIKVSFSGEVSPLASTNKAPLPSIGIHIDYENNRLLAAGALRDHMYDNNPNTVGYAHLMSWDLDSGKLVQDIDLSVAFPDQPLYFANDVVTDSKGNIYVTDMRASLVYKVTPNGKPSVFYRGDLLGTPNGIEILDNNLIVSDTKPVNGQRSLVKIPLNNPEQVARIPVSGDNFFGFDGVVSTQDNGLVGVTHVRGDKVSHLTKIKFDSELSQGMVSNSIAINRSTTVAHYKDSIFYVINQDFQNPQGTSWTIEKVDMN